MIALQAKGLHLEDFQHLAGSSTEQAESDLQHLDDLGESWLGEDSDSGWHHLASMCFRSLPATT